MKKKFHYGIRHEIVINMTLLALVAIVLSSLFTYKLLERHLMVEEIENAKIFANGIRDRMQFLIQINSISPNDNQAVLQQLGQFFDVAYLKKIIVVDVLGKNVAQMAQGDPESPKQVDDNLKDDLIEAMRSRTPNIGIKGVFGQVIGGKPVVTVSLPIVVQNRLWGGMALSIEIQGFRGVTTAVYKYFLIFMVMVITVLAVFGSVMMSKQIVQPLLEIVKGTRRLSQGDLHAHVDLKSENELGELADSFNSMSERLREMIQEREINLKKLESINEQLKKTQDDLVHNEKLAMVGRIAAGVAHEIGNPIGAILGYSEILKEGELPPQSKDFLRRIHSEAKRIDRMIRDMLEISRPRDRRELSKIDLKHAVSATVDLVQTQEQFKNIPIGLEIGTADPLWILADLHQIQQILINLFMNSAQAIQVAKAEKGSLTVRLKTGIFNEYKDIAFQAGAIKTPRKENDPVMVVEIQDNGPGIDEKILGQVFEPFFTTREPGQGTGLGLYIVSRLLETLNARITIENVPAGGTKISLIFPQEI